MHWLYIQFESGFFIEPFWTLRTFERFFLCMGKNVCGLFDSNLELKFFGQRVHGKVWVCIGMCFSHSVASENFLTQNGQWNGVGLSTLSTSLAIRLVWTFQDSVFSMCFISWALKSPARSNSFPHFILKQVNFFLQWEFPLETIRVDGFDILLASIFSLRFTSSWMQRDLNFPDFTWISEWIWCVSRFGLSSPHRYADEITEKATISATCMIDQLLLKVGPTPKCPSWLL